MNFKRISIILFSIIAFLISLALFIFLYLMANVKNDGVIINISGRQRMLSQKITKLCLLIENNTDKNNNVKELNTTIELFETSHCELIKPNEKFGFNYKNSDTIIILFSDLQSQYEDIIINAEKIVNNQDSNHKALKIILVSEKHFLKTMDKIVFQYEAENSRKLRLIKYSLILITIFILLILFVEVQFIIFPIVNRDKKSFNTIKNQNEALIISKEEIRTTNEELFATTKSLREGNENLIIAIEKANESEKRFKTMVGNVPGIIYRSLNDKHWTTIYFSKETEKITGYPSSDFINNKVRSYSSIIYPKDLEFVDNTIQENLKENRSFEIEYRIINKNNKILWVLEKGTGVRDEQGKLLYLDGAIFNIDERKKNEAEITLKNKQITDSINYAKKIQYSILPDISDITKHFQRCFIYFKPKSIIGGDFYWFFNTNNLSYIAAVDCTGHGVPGALMSMTVNSLLNEIMFEGIKIEPNDILSSLHSKLYQTLNQQKGDMYSQDGCDISLCMINRSEKQLHFAGAHQNAYICNKNSVTILKGTPKSIGALSLLGHHEPERSFENNITKISEDFLLVLVSDGILDQLNKNNDSFGTNRLLEMIKLYYHNNDKTMIHNKIESWKHNTTQLDDMLMISLFVKV